MENECTFQPQGANKNYCMVKRGYYFILIDFLDKLDDLLWKTLCYYGANLPARQMIGIISD